MSSTRRDFLRSALGASTLVSLSPAVPSLLSRTARAAAGNQDRDTVLVVVQLSGGNDGLKHLHWLSQLQTLALRHGDINDEGLRLLRGLDSVQSLNLNRTQVTSAGIAHLVNLRGLRVLLLQNTQVDDRALPHLTQLKGLRAINLLDTDFTDEGVEALRRSMPNTQILF